MPEEQGRHYACLALSFSPGAQVSPMGSHLLRGGCPPRLTAAVSSFDLGLKHF